MKSTRTERSYRLELCICAADSSRCMHGPSWDKIAPLGRRPVSTAPASRLPAPAIPLTFLSVSRISIQESFEELLFAFFPELLWLPVYIVDTLIRTSARNVDILLRTPFPPTVQHDNHAPYRNKCSLPSNDIVARHRSIRTSGQAASQAFHILSHPVYLLLSRGRLR
jgi:hypothetical protein